MEAGYPSFRPGLQSGDVFVHEYGHNMMGCGHREDCEYNIMDDSSDGTNDALNGAECEQLGGVMFQEWCGEMVPLSEPTWWHWVTCDIYVPAGQLFGTKPLEEWQFRHGTTLTSHGTFETPGGGVSMYGNWMSPDRRGLEVSDVAYMTVTNGGQIRLH